MTIDTLGRGWLTECGMAALMCLAVITSLVAAVQMRGWLRHRGESDSPEGRHAAPLWSLMTLALALAFWLMLAAVWLFHGIGHRSGIPWWR